MRLLMLNTVVLAALSLQAADNKDTPLVATVGVVPTEIAAEFFAAESQLLRAQAAIPPDVQAALAVATKNRDTAVAAVMKFCEGKGTPESLDKGRIVCKPTGAPDKK